MGARRLTNKAVAEKAGVGVMTVSKIRNGNSGVGYMTLKKVVEALGLTIAEVAEPGAVRLSHRDFLQPELRVRDLHLLQPLTPGFVVVTSARDLTPPK